MTFRQLMSAPVWAVHDDEPAGGGAVLDELEELDPPEEDGRQTPPPPPGLTEAQEFEIANKVLKSQGLSALSQAEIEALRQPSQVRNDDDPKPELNPYADFQDIADHVLAVQKWEARQENKNAPAPANPEQAVMTRLSLAERAEQQVRAEFPGLPEEDVSRIRNAFFDTRYGVAELQASFDGKTHLAYGALAYNEATKAGKISRNAVGVPGRSPIAGTDIQEQIPGEDKGTYDKFIQAFGKAYMKDGKIDHKLARQRFREAAYAQ